MSPTRERDDQEEIGTDQPFREDENAEDLLGGGGGDPEEEDDGEDLFGDRMEDDYRVMPELDKYDPEDVDHGDYSDMDIDDRLAAEREMKLRDKREGRSATKGKIKGSHIRIA